MYKYTNIKECRLAKKAYKIIKKEFGKRRYKRIMIKSDEVDSSIVLYYHDKTWENVDDILEKYDITEIDRMNAMTSIEMF